MRSKENRTIASDHSRRYRLLVRILMAGMLIIPVLRSAADGYQAKTLYSFSCSSWGEQEHCLDGAYPKAELTMDGAGNLYGTTAHGGVYGNPDGNGTVFELTPDLAKTAWTHKVLYSFCAQPSCHDGFGVNTGLIIDASGNLYGTTYAGGEHTYDGTVFKLTPDATKTSWTHKVLYSFCAQTGCADGAGPQASLYLDRVGNLFGTTTGTTGRPGRDNTVFELTPNAAGTAWTHKVLYNFCAQAHCTDGKYPVARLIMDTLDNLYGTTSLGGSGLYSEGTVFDLAPNADKSAWTYKVLYSFCVVADCTDGAMPQAGLIMDGAGNLYGTTEAGGANEHTGTVFELVPNVGKTKWLHEVLYSFCAQAGCADGGGPEAGLIIDSSGDLYGTAAGGGDHYGGTVFVLVK